MTRLAAVTLILLLAGACLHRVSAPPSKPPAWILPFDADGNDPFCAEITPAPLINPGDQGLRCTSVRTIRLFLAQQRRAH